VGNSDFVECDWSDFYMGAEEALPPNAPKPLGKGVMLQMFVDSNHAGDKVSQCSRSSVIIFLNYGMIDWLLKKQPTVETSVFGAKFCAMKHSIENLHGICYKLRMMSVPIKGTSYIYGDNMSVVTNVSKPESTLRKNSNSICYHAVRVKPLLPTSLQRRILLICSLRCCMVRRVGFLLTGCYGMCSPAIRHYRSPLARVWLMTGPCH